MITFRQGLSRFVILFGPVAIKLPRLWAGDGILLLGLIGNILERDRYARSGGHPALARVLWCAPFGLVLVMPRYRRLVPQALTPADLAGLPFVNVDNKPENFALTERGVVALDYGNIDQHLVLPPAGKGFADGAQDG